MNDVDALFAQGLRLDRCRLAADVAVFDLAVVDAPGLLREVRPDVFGVGQDMAHGLEQDGLGLGTLDKAWGVEIWVRNLTDERVANIIFDTPFQAGSQSAFMEPPRTAGITLRRNF